MAIVSVIVPVYNVEAYVGRCIDSVLSQTFTDLELILVDDGSSDKSGDICDEYATRDSRIRVIHKDNGGVSSARNAGLDYVFSQSSSEWLCFVDSDDWVSSRYIELLLEACINCGVDISACSHKKTEQEETILVKEEAFSVLSAEDFCCDYVNDSYIVMWGKLYKRSCFEGVRFPLGKIHEDEFVVYKLLFAAKKVAYTSSHLYNYFVRQGSIMTSEWSVKRMDGIFAIGEQLEFAEKNAYIKFKIHTSKRYYYSILVSLARLKQTKNKALINEYKGILAKKLKKAKRQFKECGHCFNYDEYDLQYGIVYPVTTRIRRYKNALLRRIGKNKNR